LVPAIYDCVKNRQWGSSSIASLKREVRSYVCLMRFILFRSEHSFVDRDKDRSLARGVLHSLASRHVVCGVDSHRISDNKVKRLCLGMRSTY
jgi:hypothetical protein